MNLETSSASTAKLDLKEDLAFWEMHYQQCQASPLNRKAYCREHQLNYDRFQYWYRKLDKESKPTANTASSLIPVKLPITTLKRDPICQLNTKQGHQLLIYHSSMLKEVLEKIL